MQKAFTAYQQFTIDYKLIGMSKSCCKFRHYGNGTVVYVHRNNINDNDNWADFRVVEKMFNGMKINMVEVLKWKSF